MQKHVASSINDAGAPGMREFDVYIDGVRLPPWILRDAETQVGARSDFYFEDSVLRADAVADSDGDYDLFDEFTPAVTAGAPAAPFAQLDAHALTFKLGRSDWELSGRAVRLGSGDEDLRLQEPGGRLFHFGTRHWPLLKWSTPYEVYEAGNRAVRMTLEVRRVPLRDMGAALNRMERM